MGNPAQIQLVVQGDDFGMCHAVNAGIEEAFVRGILTQASTMAVCPWVDEALDIATRLGIPVGLHQTLTCDWDRLRWGSLTSGASLVGADCPAWPGLNPASTYWCAIPAFPARSSRR